MHPRDSEYEEQKCCKTHNYPVMPHMVTNLTKLVDFLELWTTWTLLLSNVLLSPPSSILHILLWLFQTVYLLFPWSFMDCVNLTSTFVYMWRLSSLVWRRKSSSLSNLRGCCLWFLKYFDCREVVSSNSLFSLRSSDQNPHEDFDFLHIILNRTQIINLQYILYF